MISSRLATWSLVVSLVGSPALVQPPVYGQEPDEEVEGSQEFFEDQDQELLDEPVDDCESYFELDDLDLIPDCRLERDLDNELGPDDLGYGFDEYVAIADLTTGIMWALSDDNDDPAEEEIDFDDLEGEIREAYPGSSLQDLVEQVLVQVDAQASRQRGWTFVRVQLGLRPGDGRVIVATGVSAAKQAIRQTIRVYK